jgi:hypothetical protein
MSRYKFTLADRLCAGCGQRLTAPFLVSLEVSRPTPRLVAAVHRLPESCVRALIPAVQAHDGEAYTLAMITTTPEVN